MNRIIICKNVSINIYNRSKKIVTLEDDNLQNEEGDIELLIVSKEYVERVEEFIYSLDNIYKEVILLKAQIYDETIDIIIKFAGTRTADGIFDEIEEQTYLKNKKSCRKNLFSIVLIYRTKERRFLYEKE